MNGGETTMEKEIINKGDSFRDSSVGKELKPGALIDSDWCVFREVLPKKILMK